MTIASTFFATGAPFAPLAGSAGTPPIDPISAHFSQLLGANLAQPSQPLQGGTTPPAFSSSRQQPTMTAMGLVLEAATAGSAPAAPTVPSEGVGLQRALEQPAQLGTPDPAELQLSPLRAQPDAAANRAENSADPAHGSSATGILTEAPGQAAKDELALSPPEPTSDTGPPNGKEAASVTVPSLPGLEKSQQIAAGGATSERPIRDRGDQRARQAEGRFGPALAINLPGAATADPASTGSAKSNGAAIDASPQLAEKSDGESSPKTGPVDQWIQPEAGKPLEAATRSAFPDAQPALVTAASQPTNPDPRDPPMRLQAEMQTFGALGPVSPSADGTQAHAELAMPDTQDLSAPSNDPRTGGPDSLRFNVDTEPRPIRSAGALPTPEVTARPGQIGRELGLEIARRSAAGGDELMVRLAPDEMGRIEVRMSFDAGGTLRAVVTAENQAALDMLRRDAGDLGRSLADAGVRADAQSFRFDAKSGDGGTGWQRQGQGRDGGPGDNDAQQRDTFAGEGEDAPYHRLNSTSQIDLMA